MNKLLLLFIILLFAADAFGQNIGINSTGSDPETCAVLDVSSSTKGFLPPRMTRGQRNFIANPVAGLIIWCSDCGASGELQVYSGTAWTNMVGGIASGSSTLEIGDTYQGGKIAYILQDGDPGYSSTVVRGLIAATYDGGGAQWGCIGMMISGADGTAIGTGNQNSIDIVAGCTTGGIAARICLDATINGYSDWYLPSRDELNKLCLNRVAIGGFVENGYYWSSSEYDSSSAWFQPFHNSSSPNPYPKNAYNYVRAVRAF